MKKIMLYLISGLVLLVGFSCQHKPLTPKTEVVARVDNRALTLSDFRRFYETDPTFGVDSSGYRALRDELDRFIDYHLAYRRAERSGLISDSLFQRAVQWEKRQAMLRQLYREVVDPRIHISDAELKREYFTANVSVHIRHLFSRDSLTAARWYRELRKGASFDSLARLAFHDSLLAGRGGDLGWQKLWNLDESFGDAVLRLKKNEISRPLRTRWGFHVAQLLDRRDQVILRADEFARQKPMLEKRIRLRKSKEFAHEFISRFMGKLNPQPVPRVFSLLWKSIVLSVETGPGLRAPAVFTNELIGKVKKRIPGALNDPLITYRSGRISLNDYLAALRSIPVSNRPRFKTPRQLSNQLGKWVRDEFLLKEAERRGIGKNARVQKEVAEFAREQSYLYYLNRELEQMEIPEWANQYFKKHDKSVIKAHTGLAKYHTLQEWLWARATRSLHQTLKKPSESIWIDQTVLKNENERIDWQNRIPMFIIRKPE